MPSWNELLSEVKSAGSTHDLIRRQYFSRLHEVTKRNVILYYSGWLEKSDLARQGHPGIMVNDGDKNGLMAAVHDLDPSLGLDLLLHTPGGETAATESLVDYLRAIFGTNIRAVIPLVRDKEIIRYVEPQYKHTWHPAYTEIEFDQWG